MLGVLDAAGIESVLKDGLVGRIGAHADGRTYVVPVTYAYEPGYVYCHSLDGMKVRMMRSNPDVCFEVDDVDGPGHWRSVIAWGRYEELTGDLATAAMNLLASRLAALQGSETAGPAGPEIDGIAYRIRLTERTGRFERR